jgi:hypothetical protein
MKWVKQEENVEMITLRDYHPRINVCNIVVAMCKIYAWKRGQI